METILEGDTRQKLVQATTHTTKTNLMATYTMNTKLVAIHALKTNSLSSELFYLLFFLFVLFFFFSKIEAGKGKLRQNKKQTLMTASSSAPAASKFIIDMKGAWWHVIQVVHHLQPFFLSFLSRISKILFFFNRPLRFKNHQTVKIARRRGRQLMFS